MCFVEFDVLLEPLRKDDEVQFILDNQEAFNMVL